MENNAQNRECVKTERAVQNLTFTLLYFFTVLGGMHKKTEIKDMMGYNEQKIPTSISPWIFISMKFNI